MNWSQIYTEWGIPYITIGSGKLIERENAAQLIEHIYRDNYDLLGYDAFTVFPNGTRQPSLEFSASFSKEMKLSLSEAIKTLNDHSAAITHYEFVFVPSNMP